MQQWGVFQKHQSQNAIRISERLLPVPIFFFSNPGLTYLPLHFATQMSFLLLSLFLFRKMWKLIVLLSPSHFRAWLSQIISRARDMGRVCGYKYKINYRPSRQQSQEFICKSIICHSSFKCNFLVLFAITNNV